MWWLCFYLFRFDIHRESRYLGYEPTLETNWRNNEKTINWSDCRACSRLPELAEKGANLVGIPIPFNASWNHLWIRPKFNRENETDLQVWNVYDPNVSEVKRLTTKPVELTTMPRAVTLIVIELRRGKDEIHCLDIRMVLREMDGTGYVGKRLQRPCLLTGREHALWE